LGSEGPSHSDGPAEAFLASVRLSARRARTQLGVTDRYRKLDDLPAALPLFPLRGVILLPRSTLPLNVFEPRYLALLDDVLAGGRLLGVVQPQGGAEQEESPSGKAVPLRQVGCVGRVMSFAEGDDGRSRISVVGIVRFRLVEEQATSSPYRVVRVRYDEFVSDLASGRGEGEVDRKRLLGVLRNYLTAHELSADWDSINRSSNELLVNTLSMISPYGPEEKQALLEAPDLKARAEVLIALAEMELAARNDGSGSTVQ
jgi:Lon protease-like protein